MYFAVRMRCHITRELDSALENRVLRAQPTALPKTHDRLGTNTGSICRGILRLGIDLQRTRRRSHGESGIRGYC